jgi:outer membrane receptor for ferrienterochelin and colicins
MRFSFLTLFFVTPFFLILLFLVLFFMTLSFLSSLSLAHTEVPNYVQSGNRAMESSVTKSSVADNSTTQNPVKKQDLSQNTIFEASELLIEDSVGANHSYKIRPRLLTPQQNRSFVSLLENQRGLDTQLSCAFCGSKRVTINGHRGEHTSFFVDGLSLHSSISSFYGVDAMASFGISSIDIYRGASNTYTLAESLAGAISVHTDSIEYTESDFSLSGNHLQDSFIHLTHKNRINDQWGFLMGFQTNTFAPWDLDKNNIAEIPKQKNSNYLGKLQWRPNQQNELSLRINQGSVQTRGGHLKAQETQTPIKKLVTYEDFQDSDIRKTYKASPNQVYDQIDLQRTEIALHSHSTLDNHHKILLAGGIAKQIQKSFYSHGYDYHSHDTMQNFRGEYKIPTENEWLFSLGYDYKNQKFQSDSEVLFHLLKLPQDQVQHQAQGFFSQTEWLPHHLPFELSFSLRLNDIHTEWVKLGQKSQGFIPTPKLAFKYLQNTDLSHLFSLGRGYRSPLNLFESQHGTNHYGFTVNLDRMETSDNIHYTLIHQNLHSNSEFSANWSRIFNMAYGLDQAFTQDPTLFLNATQPYDLLTLDIQHSRKLGSWGELEFKGEKFFLPLDYKKKLPVAVPEERFQIQYLYKIREHQFQFLAHFVGSRNLNHFAQYERHYNRISVVDDIFHPDFGSPPQGLDPKKRQAPSFWTFDWHWSYRIEENLQWSVSILNLFNETQIGHQDSPLTWHIHGNHYHLDNFHIWGPLRGREFLTRLQYTF